MSACGLSVTSRVHSLECVSSRKRVIRLAHYTSPGVPRDCRWGAECAPKWMCAPPGERRQCALCRRFIKYAVKADVCSLHPSRCATFLAAGAFLLIIMSNASSFAPTRNSFTYCFQLIDFRTLSQYAKKDAIFACSLQGTL